MENQTNGKCYLSSSNAKAISPSSRRVASGERFDGTWHSKREYRDSAKCRCVCRPMHACVRAGRGRNARDSEGKMTILSLFHYGNGIVPGGRA